MFLSEERKYFEILSVDEFHEKFSQFIALGLICGRVEIKSFFIVSKVRSTFAFGVICMDIFAMSAALLPLKQKGRINFSLKFPFLFYAQKNAKLSHTVKKCEILSQLLNDV